MNMFYVIIAICLLLSAVAKGVMDHLRMCVCKSVFKKWEGNPWVDPEISWMNKYKDNDPAKGEKFFLSTTVLVFVTDLWHLSQFVFIRLFFSVPILYSFCHPIISWWVDYLIMSVFFGICFETTYKLLSTKS